MEKEEEWGERGKCVGNKKHNEEEQNRQGEVKNSRGKREAKELICPTHGHELRGRGLLEGRRAERGKGKNWDNCNNKINKIYLKKNSKILF